MASQARDNVSAGTSALPGTRLKWCSTTYAAKGATPMLISQASRFVAVTRFVIA